MQFWDTTAFMASPTAVARLHRQILACTRCVDAGYLPKAAPVLRGYADKLQAQPGRWDFLTGSKATIYDLSRNGFKLAIADDSQEMGAPVHSTRLVLVDRHGTIRGYYDATAPDAITKLLADTNHLLREQPH